MDDFRQISDAMEQVLGTRVPKPSGTLAGHAAGLPFEVSVHSLIEGEFPSRAFRHYEFLNQVFRQSHSREGADLLSALGPESLQKLLSRGLKANKNWSPDSQFLEKQDDTAETIVSAEWPYRPGVELTLLDVKTHSTAKKGQQPNIISAEKLARALKKSLDEGKVLYDFVYVGIDWVEEEESLLATDVRTVSLFRVKKMPYINWTAAQQLQFHVSDVDQDFEGSREDWAAQFLGHVWRSLVQSQDSKRSKFGEFEPYA